MPTRHPRKPDQSRRSFLRKAVAGAGATAAAVVSPRMVAEAGQQGSQNAAAATVAPIRVPAEFAAAKAAPPVTFEFPMTGAQVFARACKEEGVAALFACPGNYPVIHALASGRHSRLRRASRRIDGPRRRRVHPRHRRDRRVVRHRGPGLHRHDLRDRLRQRRAHAAAGRREQHVDRAWKTPRPAFSSAISSRRPKG